MLVIEVLKPYFTVMFVFYNLFLCLSEVKVEHLTFHTLLMFFASFPAWDKVCKEFEQEPSENSSSKCTQSTE
jgi:hypothetical protein